jgi:hypothetical protein
MEYLLSNQQLELRIPVQTRRPKSGMALACTMSDFNLEYLVSNVRLVMGMLRFQ